jgi:ADP-glucose pyrophosphorylase
VRRGEVLAIVQAGGQGARMDVLTRERAKPALPFGGVHRLVDFAMSSLYHAELDDVWVSVQYQVASIDDYLAGGRPWSLDRNRGGFRRMVPQTGTGPTSEEASSVVRRWSGRVPSARLARDADIVLVGRDCVVDGPVPAGARLEPGTTA